MPIRKPLARLLLTGLIASLSLAGCQGREVVAHPDLIPGQHHSGPIAHPPQIVPRSGPLALVVLNSTTVKGWGNYPGIQVTFRAIQGLVNLANPRIFVEGVGSGQESHDNDWLEFLLQSYGGSAVTAPDANHRIDDPAWYLSNYRESFLGYLLFDSSNLASTGVAISLAGALKAIPIDQNDATLLKTAQQDGMAQLADARGKDGTWLRNSIYWSHFNRDAIFFSQGGLQGEDYAVAMHMAAFPDDFREDPQMKDMATMISDQNPGGILFGWGHTDSFHGEDLFVAQASRYDLSVMDLPANISVYMHFPPGSYQQKPGPTLPNHLHRHYVAFVYSDGDNPAVVLDKMTLPNGDRFASPFRGTIPIGWTVPPSMAGFGAPALDWLYSHQTAGDEFIAGPSGYGYAFPFFIPDPAIFAGQTGSAISTVAIHSVVVLDENGSVGFTHAALDPLTSQSSVNGLFFVSFDNQNQPPPDSLMWSNEKPVFPTYTVYRPSGQPKLDVVSPTAAFLNGLSDDATTSSAYTLVYLDFWSVSMTDVSQLVGRLNQDVEVVRPDTMIALANKNISR